MKIPCDQKSLEERLRFLQHNRNRQSSLVYRGELDGERLTGRNGLFEDQKSYLSLGWLVAEDWEWWLDYKGGVLGLLLALVVF